MGVADFPDEFLWMPKTLFQGGVPGINVNNNHYQLLIYPIRFYLYPHWSKPQGDNPVMTESPQTQSAISVHQLVVGKPANDGTIPAQCELLRCSLQEGMDILLWRGHFAQPETLQLHDDWAGLTSLAFWKAHRALRSGDSAATPTGNSRAIVITLPIRQTAAAAPPTAAGSRALRSLSALKPSRCGCRILARSLKIRSTPTAVASSSVVMPKLT